MDKWREYRSRSLILLKENSILKVSARWGNEVRLMAGVARRNVSGKQKRRCNREQGGGEL